MDIIMYDVKFKTWFPHPEFWPRARNFIGLPFFTDFFIMYNMKTNRINRFC